jgi:hypothetical protein
MQPGESGPGGPGDDSGISIGGSGAGSGSGSGAAAAGMGDAVLTALDGLPGGILAWTLPAVMLSVPGLLLLIAIGAQAVGALAWLPLVRRRVGGFGLRNRSAKV